MIPLKTVGFRELSWWKCRDALTLCQKYIPPSHSRHYRGIKQKRDLFLDLDPDFLSLHCRDGDAWKEGLKMIYADLRD